MQMQLLKNILGKGRWGFERYGCDNHQMTPAEGLRLRTRKRETANNTRGTGYPRSMDAPLAWLMP